MTCAAPGSIEGTLFSLRRQPPHRVSYIIRETNLKESKVVPDDSCERNIMTLSFSDACLS